MFRTFAPSNSTIMSQQQVEEVYMQNVQTHLMWKTIEEAETRSINSQPAMSDDQWRVIRHSHATVIK